MIVGLTGTNASGKTTIAQFLVKKGYHYYSLSDEIREVLKFKNLEPRRENLIQVGTELRTKYGNGYLASRVNRKMKLPAVVDSIRNLGEIDELRKNEKFTLISVDAPSELRYQRARSRGRIGEEITEQKFIELEKKELKNEDKNAQNLIGCMLEADYSIINASNINTLYWQIETIIKKEGEKNAKQSAKLG